MRTLFAFTLLTTSAYTVEQRGYSHHVVLHITGTWLWLGVQSSDPLHPVPPSAPLPPTSGNHKSDCFFWMFFFQIPHISDIIQYLRFSARRISLSVRPSRPIHVVTNGKISFLQLDNILIHIHMFLSSRLLVDRHLGSSHVLAVVNAAALSVGHG